MDLPLHDRVLLRRVGEEEKSAGESLFRMLKKSRQRESWFPLVRVMR